MTTSARPRLTITRSPADAARTAAERVAEALRAAREERGEAHLSLAGGRTPRAAYEVLGPLVGDWSGVHLWFGDERCVPPDDPESNYRLVAETLLAVADIPAERVHRIACERLAAGRGPRLRGRAAARRAGRRGPGSRCSTSRCSGWGRTGTRPRSSRATRCSTRHDALVFPVRAVKPPPERITLSLDVLRAARRALILAQGPGKADAVARVLAGPDPAVPASLLVPERTELVVDEAAASRGGA